MNSRLVRHSAAVAIAAVVMVTALADAGIVRTDRSDYRPSNNKPAAAPESLLRRFPHLPKIPSPLGKYRPASSTSPPPPPPPPTGPTKNQGGIDAHATGYAPKPSVDSKKRQEQEQQLKLEQQAKQKQHEQQLKQKQQQEHEQKLQHAQKQEEPYKRDPEDANRKQEPTSNNVIGPTPVRGENTSPKTVKLETTTHDRSIITAPLKSCPDGQRMTPDRQCRPDYVDPEDAS